MPANRKGEKPEPTAANIATRSAVMSIAIDAEEWAKRTAPDATRAEGDPVTPEALLPISISSESPVERFDYWEGERYLEVLDHSPSSVDMSRAAKGLPFLDSHNSRDGKAQMGRVLNMRVEGGKLRGDVKFSRRQDAQDLRRDMIDGIKGEISVGYRIDPNNLEKTKPDGAAMATVRIKRWTPYEASSVAVPADHTVGYGRAADTSATPHDALLHFAGRDSTTPAGNGQEDAMPAPTDAPASPDVRVGDSADNAAKMREIAQIAKTHAMTEKLPEWIAEGKSPEAVRDEILATLSQRLKDSAKFASGGEGAGLIDLTPKDKARYSFARAIEAAAEGENSFEIEVSRELEKKLGGRNKDAKAPPGSRGNRIFIPTNTGSFYGERAGLDSSTSTKGTELKFVQAGSFIEMLRNKARVLRLGATMMSGLDGPVSFPKQTGAITTAWMGENPGSGVTLSELTLGAVTLAAKTLMATTKFSKQLLRQSSFDVENIVRNDIALQHALAIDLAAIAGTGSSNQPSGILTNTGIAIVTMGAAGLAPTYATMVQLEAAIEAANGDTGPRGYLTTPEIKGTLKTTQTFATGLGIPVWTGGDEGAVNGYPAFSSNQVPKNLTKGTSTTVCHAIIFGVWSNLMIGEWGALEVLVDPYTLATSGMHAVTSFQMCDIALRYAESFAASKDLLKGAGF